MKILLILLFLFTTASSKTIELIATVTYTNDTNSTIKNITHKITIPEERFYQKLEKIFIIPNTTYKIKKNKKYQNKYISIDFGDLKKNEIVSKQIHFIIEQRNLNTNFYEEIEKTKKYGIKYLVHKKDIQINSKQIKAISYLIDENQLNVKKKIDLAYKFPSKYLTYKVQKNTSALNALKTGVGDCTEFAMLFVALARSIGIEARRVSVFNFLNNKNFKVPNHHIAEIYTSKYGWMPIYPNLSQGGKNKNYLLGKISSTILLYKYKSWVWASNYGKDIDISVKWNIK